jgi:serine/threonine protein kinase
MIETGTVLQDRFLIEEQIGVGGMGAVYRATDQKFGTAVAIKETFYRDKDLAEAFEREARLLNGLHHPLFPHVSDHFTEGEGHFLVMEYIEGEDLSQILKRSERFPLETVLRWTLDLLDGIDYLHSQEPPIVHRDIKPSNLKLTSRGNLVLLDFGMAKETSGNTQGMRSVFGYSRRYSPLEQIEGAGTDERSDIFSLGATVFHLLTGTPPVDVLRRASAIVAGRPDPIQFASVLNPEVPNTVAKIIETALALSPDRRFASARAMWSALESAVGASKSASAFVGFPDDRGQLDGTTTFLASASESGDADPSNAPVFRTVTEDENDPVAALVAQRVAELKATETSSMPMPVESETPARIEVPIITEHNSPPDDIQELGPVDEPESRENFAPVPVEFDSSPPPRYRMIGLLSVPLLLLTLGLAGYLMTRSGATEEIPAQEAVQSAPPSNQPITPEGPVEPSTEEHVVQDGRMDAVKEPATPPPSDQIGMSNETTGSNLPQRSGSPVAERATTGRPEAAERADGSAVRRQEQSQARNRDRNNMTTRRRIVDEEEFEQPPVSSIESIMTGVPVSRPRRQRRWEVLEEDELRRQRRIRRINRRSRQRDQLF